MKLIILCITPLFLLSFVVSGKSRPDYIEHFSFDSNPRFEASWKILGGGAKISNDDKDFFEGKRSWYITSTSYNKEFDTFINRNFTFPNTANKIELSIYSKSIIIDEAWLKVWCLDINEDLIRKDSIKISSLETWKNFTIKIDAPGTKNVYVEIESKSKDTLISDCRINQKLWIDNFQIRASQKDSELFSFIKKRKNEKSKDHKAINLDCQNGYSLIKEFKDHKIIAFGESVHGSDEIQYYTFEAIKNLIKNENCKLILFELSFELGLRLNDIVLGETSEDLETLMALNNYNLSRLRDLLYWIKEYNSTTSQKVIISGIDTNISNMVGHNHLLEFIKKQRIERNSLQLLCEMIKKENYSEALEILLKDDAFKNMDNNKLKAIIHAINLRLKKYTTIPTLLEGDREYIQFQNAKFAIDTWLNDSTIATVYAHLGHVNKTNDFGARIYIPCFGNYMNSNYGKNYFVIAMLVGEGSILNTDSNGNITTLPLSSPIKGSLEELYLTSKYQVLYKNLSNFKPVTYIRSIGAQYTFNQFYPCSYKNRFDASIFIKRSNSYTLPSSWPKTRSEFRNYLDTQRTLNKRNK